MKESTAETPKRARRSVQSVDRALDLLEALAGADGEVAITALATRTGLHVSTVHRLLATLLRRGYVRQNPDTSRYYAGAKLAMLTEGRSRYGELRLRARPLLRSLTDATRETANLVVLDDVQAVYIDTVPSPQVVRLFTAIGNRTPLHATGAAGKGHSAWHASSHSFARAGSRLATAVSVAFVESRIAFQFFRAMFAAPRIPHRQTDDGTCASEVSSVNRFNH